MKLIADDIFESMKEEFDQQLSILHELPQADRLRFIVRFHIGYHARHPELSLLMSQEATHDTWRIKYLIAKHIRPSAEAMQNLANQTLQLNQQDFILWYYIMISASSTVFPFAPECQQLFNIDPTTDDFVEGHAAMLTTMLFGQRSS